MTRPAVLAGLAALTKPEARVLLSAQAAVAREDLYQRSVIDQCSPSGTEGASPSTEMWDAARTVLL